MANIPLVSILFTSNNNPPYVTNDVVITYYDDVTTLYYSTLNGVAITDPSYYVTLGGHLTLDSNFNPTFNYRISLLNTDGTVTAENNNNFVVSNGQIVIIGGAGWSQYRFCTDTTLTFFTYSPYYPYILAQQQTSSPSCIVITPTVCDLAFTTIPIVVKPTTATSLDGSIEIVATSTLSAVRYALVDIPYDQMSNTTGIFTGLGAGDYTIFSRDSYGCSAMLTVTIEVPVIVIIPIVPTTSDHVYYRLEYNDLSRRGTRIDIIDKDYNGAVNIVKGDSYDPFMVTLRGENGGLFDTNIASVATLKLLSETNFQYLGLFTDDDRAFQLIYYKNFGAGYTEQWRGFITPVLYQEDYTQAHNYGIAIEATDQLATLKDEAFLYNSGDTIKGNISLIQIISLILLKTDLGIPIRVSVNIFDSQMDTGAGDDPLEQTFIDAQSYSGLSCAEVLDNILGAYGACIQQWAGYWHIRRKAEIIASYAYREFTANGVYSSNGTSDKTTSAWRWKGRSQRMQALQAKGVINITHTLIKDIYYFTNGSFEDDVPFNQQIPGFSLVLNNNSGWLSIIPGNNSKQALQINSNSVNTVYGEDCYITSEAKPVILQGGDNLKFSLDFYPNNSLNSFIANFVTFKISIRVGSYYLLADSTWDASEAWIKIIVADKDFNKWNSFEITAPTPLAGTSDIQIRIMHGQTIGAAWYFVNDGDLKTEVTAGTNTGDIKWIYEETLLSGSQYSTKLRFYQLRPGTDAESSPDILRPNDYAGGTNEVVWELQATFNGFRDYSTTPVPVINEMSGFVNRFDNVKFELIPISGEIPSEKLYTYTNKVTNKKNFEKTYINGDAPIDITNALYSYVNVFTLEDGTATRLWNRTGLAEGLPLLSLLTRQIGEQTYIPKFKLTGQAFNTGLYFGFDACLTEYGKNYAPAGMTIHDRMCEYDLELYEITTENAGPSGTSILNAFDTGAFDPLAFGNSFDI